MTTPTSRPPRSWNGEGEVLEVVPLQLSLQRERRLLLSWAKALVLWCLRFVSFRGCRGCRLSITRLTVPPAGNKSALWNGPGPARSRQYVSCLSDAKGGHAGHAETRGCVQPSTADPLEALSAKGYTIEIYIGIKQRGPRPQETEVGVPGSTGCMLFIGSTLSWVRDCKERSRLKRAFRSL